MNRSSACGPFLLNAVLDPTQHGGNHRSKGSPIQYQPPVRGTLNAEMVWLQPEITIALNRPGLVFRTGYEQQGAGNRRDDDAGGAFILRQPGFAAERSQGDQAFLAVQIRHSPLLLGVATCNTIFLGTGLPPPALA